MRRGNLGGWGRWWGAQRVALSLQPFVSEVDGGSTNMTWLNPSPWPLPQLPFPSYTYILSPSFPLFLTYPHYSPSSSRSVFIFSSSSIYLICFLNILIISLLSTSYFLLILSFFISYLSPTSFCPFHPIYRLLSSIYVCSLCITSTLIPILSLLPFLFVFAIQLFPFKLFLYSFHFPIILPVCLPSSPFHSPLWNLFFIPF